MMKFGFTRQPSCKIIAKTAKGLGQTADIIIKGDGTMTGVVTKKHFIQIWRAFGFKKAMRILLSREPVALLTLLEV
jgi:hypothetical protein